jgi:Xaa-Pro aminopeptidase
MATKTTTPVTSPKKAAHDGDITPELKKFMTQKWAEPAALSTKVLPVAAHTARRRVELSAAFPGEVLIVSSGRLVFRSNDTPFAFRAHSAYAWLTGHLDEGGVLVMTPLHRGSKATGHKATLYVRPRNGRTTIDFYRDRDYGELWVGPRPGVADVSKRLNITCASLEKLPEVLATLAATEVSTRTIRGVDPIVDKAIRTKKKPDAQFASTLSELRLVKDDWEVAELQYAVNATRTGFDEVIAEFPAADSERWLEGTFFRRARTDGNNIGYGSIVACGSHACVLHWTDNDGAVKPGELALLDMGVEGHNLYTADVTRTVPISGTFTEPQRRVYEIVLEAQQAGIDATRAGESFLAPHKAAMEVIVTHLLKWGLLHGDVEGLLKSEVYKRYTLHGTSHMLGIDVHDCAQARNEMYRGGTLAAGMVLTVEPGLYFQRDDLSVPAELRGIGVRIEDDVVVTRGAPRVLSADIPRQARDVERWVQQLTKRSRGRK